MMSNYNYKKYFECEDLGLCIEFYLLDNKYIAHKIFKNGRLIVLRPIDYREHLFFRECLMCYDDYLKRNNIIPYKGVED